MITQWHCADKNTANCSPDESRACQYVTVLVINHFFSIISFDVKGNNMKTWGDDRMNKVLKGWLSQGWTWHPGDSNTQAFLSPLCWAEATSTYSFQIIPWRCERKLVCKYQSQLPGLSDQILILLVQTQQRMLWSITAGLDICLQNSYNMWHLVPS